jgi:hypothetical protein
VIEMVCKYGYSGCRYGGLECAQRSAQTRACYEPTSAKDNVEDWCDGIIVEASGLLDNCELSPIYVDSLNYIINVASKIKKAL